MWYPSVSLILAIVIGVRSFHDAFATTISFYSEEAVEDVGLSFIGEAMDKCSEPTYRNTVQLGQMGLDNVREDFVDSINVQSIILEGNDITNISRDAFRSVPNLSCLNIRNNGMLLGNLTNLNHGNLLKLNLAQNRIFSDQTEWKVFLPHLTHLDLSDNDIAQLPLYENFRSSLPSLTHFYFSGNRFTGKIFDYLPWSTQNLYMERITNRVYLDGKLPRNIFALYLNQNIIYWSGQIQSVNLKVLSMRECKGITNQILSIEANNLVDLDLSSNDLSYLPNSMFINMKSLRRLSLENNSLSSFDVLNNVSSLTDLSLNFNSIENITSHSIAGLRNLKRLYLRGNRIAMVEAEAFLEFNLLEKLDLAENRLTTLPTTLMFTLQGLFHLNLRSNLFTTFEDMSINGSVKLKHIFVGKNNFTQIEMFSLVNVDKNTIVHVS